MGCGARKEKEIEDTPCCAAPFVWISFNREMPKNAGKIDHWACMKCGKPCVKEIRWLKQLSFGF